MKKTLCLILFLAIAVSTLTSCGLSSIVDTAMEEGDFVYNIKEDQNGTKYAVILDFSEEGKKKETIFVPECLGGYKVGRFNTTTGFGSNFGDMESDNLKRIYFKYDLDFASDCFYNCKNLEKVLVFKYMIQPESYLMRFPNIGDVPVTVAANVSFWDGDELYWIDDYDYGSLISVQPPEPENQGFTFLGWYKEPELLNKWDFNIDKLPELILDEYNQASFLETKLYAKWSKVDSIQ